MRIKEYFSRYQILLVFLFCFAYWFYLILSTHMVIACDAMGYEALGKILAQKDWLEYFRQGLNREPLYPFLVSLSIRLGVFLHISYQLIQVVIQFFIIFITQLLMLYVLRRLKIKNWISAGIILYFGISPAIINSALSLFSEVSTYPLVLGVVVFAYQSWLSFFKEKSRVILPAVLTSIFFLLLAFNKAIFEPVTLLFGVFVFGTTFFTGKRKVILNGFIWLIVFFAFFGSGTTGYRFMNKSFNGYFEITDRGKSLFYGSVIRRTEPLNKKRILSAFTYVAGENVCNALFGKEECDFWSFEKVDQFRFQKSNELVKKRLPPNRVDNELFLLSFPKIFHKPFQYFSLTFLESWKAFFWESAKIGFVSYPVLLENIFNCVFLKNTLRAIMALLTFLSIVYSFYLLLLDRKNLFICKENHNIVILLTLILICLFNFFSALATILPRHIFPIVPLYLILIGSFIQELFDLSP